MDEKLLTLIQLMCREKKTAAVRALVDAWDAAGRPGLDENEEGWGLNEVAEVLDGTDEEKSEEKWCNSLAENLKSAQLNFDVERRFCDEMQDFLNKNFPQEYGSLCWSYLFADKVTLLLLRYKTIRDTIKLVASFFPSASITNVLNKVEKQASDAAGS